MTGVQTCALPIYNDDNDENDDNDYNDDNDDNDYNDDFEDYIEHQPDAEQADAEQPDAEQAAAEQPATETTNGLFKKRKIKLDDEDYIKPKRTKAESTEESDNDDESYDTPDSTIYMIDELSDREPLKYWLKNELESNPGQNINIHLLRDLLKNDKVAQGALRLQNHEIQDLERMKGALKNFISMVKKENPKHQADQLIRVRK